MKLSLLSRYRIHNWVLDLLFPEKCLGCQKKGLILCDTCIASLRPAERETTSHTTAAYDYRDPLIKRAIWKLKYYNRPHLGLKLGALLFEALLEDIADMRTLAKGSPLLVIPVPLSRARKKMRKYNQAERIAKGFCEAGGKEIFELDTTIVSKKRDTTPQAKITNRVTRLQNIRGAFEIVKPALVKGRTIIVIDDVTTTGGTITEILKILKKNGAKKVVGFAVAH